MRIEKENDFVSLLQDETFLNRIKNTDGLENQLEILEGEYPGQGETVAYAIEFVRANLSDKSEMHKNDVAAIWQNIMDYTNKSKRFTFRRFSFYELLKVAAVLVIVLTSSIYAYQRLTRSSFDEFAAIETIADDEAMIILSDGSKYKLSKKDSMIEYAANGGQIVIKGDRQEERLENPNNSKSVTINQIIAPYGHRHRITLSDGTCIQLNAGSRLVFPAEFSGKTREVYLKGEGYFEVFKNPDKPFIVKTDFIDIKVLGTVFNISVYDDEKTATTVLVEGKVAISQKNKLFGTKEKNLSPGQGCFYSAATETSEIRNVDLQEYISWKDGLLLFKDKPVINIVSRVEKYYNKKILIDGEKLSNTLVSGKLVLPDNFDEVIQYLAKTLEARYEKNEEGNYHITD